MDEFAQASILEYEKQPEWQPPLPPLGHFGGEALVCLQSPSCVLGKTVVTSFWEQFFTQVGSPESKQGLGAGVAEYLKSNGVKRICSGHKPLGSFPFVTQIEGIQLVIA